MAHRGYSGAAPENTLAAVEAALDAGADAVEFDLRVTADGVPVLHHDETLARTGGGGDARPDALPFAALADRDAGAWFSPGFRGEPIPALETVLRRVDGWPGRLYAEIKPTARAGDAERVAEVVAEAGAVGRTVFISIDWPLLDRVRARLPEASIGYVVTGAADAPAAIDRARGDVRALVDFDRRIPLGDPATAERARAAGVAMAAWTVDDPAEADRLLALGIPRITTNQVARLVAWRRAREAAGR